ncbi:MAG: aminotransferase class V-fold PLP-dependent enzyme [Planctomycetota bacterium]
MDLIYLDNAATSFPKAPGVGEAAASFIAQDAANPGRAGHRMAVAAEAMLDAVRLKLTRLFNGKSHERMVFTMNGTDALNIAIKGVVFAHGHTAPPHVVTTVLEHNSVSRPLQAMADAGAITLTRVDCDDAGRIDPDDVAAALRPETVLVVLTHASNVTGTIQDAAAIGAVTRAAGALFLLDAAQTAGVVPIDIEAMQIDLLAFPGHKSLLGPTGTGALYVGERCPGPHESPGEAGRFAPFREGGTGGDSSTPTQPALYPYYLEGGTPNTVGIAGWSAGIDFVLARPMAEILQHEQALCEKVVAAFSDDDRFEVLGTTDPAARVGTVSLNVAGMDASDVGSILDDSFEIAVRPGLHCSPYAHQRFGTFPDGAVRVSPGAFTTAEEVDQLVDALGQIAG